MKKSWILGSILVLGMVSSLTAQNSVPLENSSVQVTVSAQNAQTQEQTVEPQNVQVQEAAVQGGQSADDGKVQKGKKDKRALKAQKAAEKAAADRARKIEKENAKKDKEKGKEKGKEKAKERLDASKNPGKEKFAKKWKDESGLQNDFSARELNSNFREAVKTHPELKKIVEEEYRLTRISRDLAKKYKNEEDPAKKTEIEAELKKVVELHFEIRQQRRFYELKLLEEKLQAVRQQIEKRVENKTRIVDRRIIELIGSEDDLSF